RASGHPGLPTHDGPAPRIAQRVRVRAHAPFVQGLRIYVLTTTHTGTIIRTDVHRPVVSTGPRIAAREGEAVSVESEFMIELDELIDELGAEAGDVLLIRPGHPRPYSLTRFLPEERVARASHKLMRYLPEV